MAEIASTLSSHVERIVASSTVLSERYHGIILPWCSEMAERLELPPWNLYIDAWAVYARDAIKASSSAYNVSYLTLRPVAILLWILMGHLWKFVLEHGGRSLQTAAIHFKWACIHFYRFQLSLNATQLLGEVGLILVCVGLYYLRKWLLRQTYWAKFVKSYKAKKRRYLNAYKSKKRRLLKAYTDTVHKIAAVSKLLAMALPHLIFLAIGISLLIVFPGVIRWITYETPTIAVLSVYYPLVSTLVWVHTQRYDWEGTASSTSEKMERNVTKSINSITSPTKPNTTSQTSSTVAERRKKFVEKAKSKAGRTLTKKMAPTFVVETAAIETTKYWLQYWQLYACIQAFGSCVSMVPIVGRFLVSHPIVGFVSGECKLLFFVWVFGMEKLLGKTSKDAFLAETLPIRLLQKFITPVVLQLHSLVSDAISKVFWQKWVVSKIKTTLDIAVMVRVVSESRRDWLVHIVEEARVLTLPSITLLMPGFITQFGVAYVQYMVPSAKSAQASSKTTKLVYLQYWILHCGAAGLLHKLSGLLWWVPFSSHMVFLLWSYLSLPQAIDSWYGIVESELLAFGILPQGTTTKADGDGSSAVRISDTKTAWLFQRLVERLPSATINVEQEENEINIVSDDSPISLKKQEEETPPDTPTITAEPDYQKPETTKTKAEEPISVDTSPPPSLTAETSSDVSPVADAIVVETTDGQK